MPAQGKAGRDVKKAIVIGASSGIGRELSRLLAANGFALAIVARRTALLNDLQNELHNGALVRQLDVRDSDATLKTMAELIETMGGVDLVVYATGSGDLNEALEWSSEYNTIATNVLGFTAVANVALKHFVERQSGHLVAISSIAALRGGRGAPAYNASKAFIAKYLEGLRQKVTHLGLPIVVTEIQPGFVDTDMAKGEGLFWVASANEAARQIHAAIVRKKSHAYVTRRWRLIAWVLRIMPAALYRRM